MIPKLSEHTTFDDITYAEWICYDWVEIRTMGTLEGHWICLGRRPLDESMKLAGGSINDLKPYLEELEKNG